MIPPQPRPTVGTRASCALCWSTRAARSADEMVLTLGLRDRLVRLHVARTVRSFPGLDAQRPTLIVATDPWFAVASVFGLGIDDPFEAERETLRPELWADEARLDRDGLQRFLLSTGLDADDVEITSLEQLRQLPRFQAQRWSSAYLRALGLLAGAVALVAVLLFAAQQQQARLVGAALTRRMGLTSTAGRLALLLELGAVLLAALLLGAVSGLGAAYLAVPLLDPLPQVPPAARTALPLAVLAAATVVLALLAVAAALALQRRTETADTSRVLRVAE